MNINTSNIIIQITSHVKILEKATRNIYIMFCMCMIQTTNLGIKYGIIIKQLKLWQTWEVVS